MIVWTEERREELERLWWAMTPLREIAEHFGLAERSIANRIKQYGLPRRFTRAGAPIPDIAAMAARMPAPAEKRWPSKTRSKPKPDDAERKRRKCLKCGNPFVSDGPGNRICKSCKPRVDFAAGGIDVARTGEALW